MVFGNEMRLPLELVTENLNHKEETVCTPYNYVRILENVLHELYGNVRDVTKQDGIRHKRNYDRNVREINYDTEDLVRRNQKQIKKGTKSKLARNWTGPWYVVKRLSAVLYQIRHSKTSKPVIVHADNLEYTTPCDSHRIYK